MRALLPAVGILIALGVAAEAGPRRGKVVRVERRRVSATPGIHVCIREPRRAYLLCVGERPPPRGERIALLGLGGSPVGGSADAQEFVEVDRTEAAAEDDCGTGLIHAVHTISPSGVAAAEPFMIGFRGVRVGRAGKLQFQPSLRPPIMGADEQALLGLDADGDGTTDLLVTRRECAETAVKLGARSAECWTYYRDDHIDWRLVGEDVIVQCNRP